MGVASFLRCFLRMKPPPPLSPGRRRRFPVTDFCFQSNLSDWHGTFWLGGDDDSPARRFNRFNRDLLRESRRERRGEMYLFGFIMLIAAWPVIGMAVNVVTLLLHGHS